MTTVVEKKLKKPTKFTYRSDLCSRGWLKNEKTGRSCITGQFFEKCGVTPEMLKGRSFYKYEWVEEIFGVKEYTSEFDDVLEVLGHLMNVNDSHTSFEKKIPKFKALFRKLGVRFQVSKKSAQV